jgi:capsule polysaccharide export protein KpsE/RkpR
MSTNKTSETLTSTIEQGDELESLGYSTPLEPTETSPSSLKSIEVAWLLWDKRAFLKRVLFVGLVVSTAIAFLISNRYVATAQLMPPDFSSSSDLIDALPALSTDSGAPGAGAGAGAAAAGGGVMGLANKLLGLNSTGQLMIGVLNSRTITDSIIQRFGLQELYSTTYPEDTRKELADYTDFEEDSKSGIITITVEDKSPERAAAIAQAYPDELNSVLSQVNASSAHRERLFVEQRLSEVKSDLDNSAKEFSQFASQNATFDITEQSKAMVSAAADLQAQIITAQSMLRGFQQIYTDSNPRIRQLQAQITELEAQLQKMGGKNLTAADGSGLSKDDLYPSIRQLPLLGVRYLDLYRRSKIDEAVYELLSKELELAKLQEARNMPTVQVLDLSVVPQKKAGPHRLLLVAEGTSACVFFGMVWIVGIAKWERTDPRHPWKELTQEVIASTKASTWDSPRGRRIRARLSRMRRSRKPDLPNDSGDVGS